MKNCLPLLFLGIEGGATRTVALLADAEGTLLQRVEVGPGNLRLLTDAELTNLFRSIRASTAPPTSVAIGLAGARSQKDWDHIQSLAAAIWPRTPLYATHDLETALVAGQSPDSPQSSARVLVLSGTGSCCYGHAGRPSARRRYAPASHAPLIHDAGRLLHGVTAKVGGWGHLLGDPGSAYAIGLQALKLAIERFDQTGDWPRLGQRCLRLLLLNQPDELVPWIHAADKSQIAALAPEVFAAWHERDPLASTVLVGAGRRLAQDAADCAQRLVNAGSIVEFVLAGSNLLRQPTFARLVSREIRNLWPKARVSPLPCESAWGAVRLAQWNYESTPAGSANVAGDPQPKRSRVVPPPPPSVPASSPQQTLRREMEQSPTEQRNPRSMNLDSLSIAEGIDLMLSEDARLPKAILAERASLEKTIRWMVRAFRQGGRLFYVGAGTSGRLGVLDASECPPTFRTPPEQVQAIMAGGYRALWQSLEGAEDDREEGRRAIAFRGVDAKDVVIGIAASGRTPFVAGALREAKQRRAITVLLTFNPQFRPAPGDRPRLIIAPHIGPEVLTGSTRLKAGTATKLILNLFTTLAMVQMGKVISNLMVDVNPSNAKLKDRAVRIVQQLTGADSDQARAALERADWVVKNALRLLPGNP